MQQTKAQTIGHPPSVVPAAVAALFALQAGFFLALRIPVWASVAVVLAAEAITAFFIRGNLTLNMLHPFDTVRAWQNAA